MGIEVAVAVVSAAVAGASAYEQRQEQKSAAKKEKEARAVSQAEKAAQQTAQTRQQVREERIRRAQILQQSQNTGVGQSSGALGSTGALQTNIGSNIAATSRQTASYAAIGNLQQGAADNLARASEIGAIGQFAGSAIQIGGAYASDLFKDTPAQGPTPVGGQSPATEPNPYSIDNLFK